LDERKRFIEEWHRRKHSSFADLCRDFEVARKTGYKWVERFKLGGWAELEDASRAPHSSPQAIAEERADEIVAFRQQHPSWGARKIREHFKREKPEQRWPAASSIHALLHDRGLIADRRKRRKTPPYTQPLQHAEAPNQVWCADFKGWFRCGDGIRCDPLTITDAHSRYLLRCRAVSKTDGVHVRSIFEAVFRQYGLPEAIRTDNGAPFASPAPAGLSRLSMWWLQLGIRHERIDPGHPEQNGRHERMHRTLKAETANPPSANVRQQQTAFHRFEQEYNYLRPHEALDYRTPSELYVPSGREYPRRLPELQYPPGVHLRRISQQGSLKWKTQRTFLSEVLARQTVGLLEVDDDLFEVYYGPLLLGWFEAAAHIFVVQKRPPKMRRNRAAEAKPQTS
jgi:transposase InsO family protein